MRSNRIGPIKKWGKTMRNRIEKGEELIAMTSTASADVDVGANGGIF